MEPTPDKVLLVAQSPDLTPALERALREGGWTVQTVGSGAGAMAVLRTAEPEVVITELTLPDLSGRHMLRAVRNVDPDLPVIVVAAACGVDTVLDVIRAGAFDFLILPRVDRAPLLAAMDRARVSSRLVQENRRLTASLHEAQEHVAQSLRRELDAVRVFGDRIKDPLESVLGGLRELGRLQLDSRGLDLVAQLRAASAQIGSALDGLEDSRFADVRKWEHFELYKLVTHARDTVLRDLHQRNLDLAYFLPAILPRVRGSWDQAAEALRRAIRFGAARGGPGSVELRVAIVGRDDKDVQVRFEVRGPVKGPIRRVDRVGDFDLDMWKQMVYALGGQSGATELEEGVLALWFILSLQLVEQEDQPRPLRGEGVLVIDPDSARRRCLTMEVGALGGRALGVSSIEAALDVLERERAGAEVPISVLVASLAQADLGRLVASLEGWPATPGLVTVGRLGAATPMGSGYHLVMPPHREQLAAAVLAASGSSHR